MRKEVCVSGGRPDPVLPDRGAGMIIRAISVELFLLIIRARTKMIVKNPKNASIVSSFLSPYTPRDA